MVVERFVEEKATVAKLSVEEKVKAPKMVVEGKGFVYRYGWVRNMCF